MAKTIWREPSKREVSKDGDAAKAEGRRTSEGSGAAVELKDKAGKNDQLEVNLDGTWYSAKLSLGEDGSTTVHYDGYTDEEDDQRWDAKKIKSFKPLRDYIRVISEPLEDDECGVVHVNTIVCALRKAKDEEVEGWHDAFVTAVRKRDHIHGENCTCSFTVVWRDGPHKGRKRSVGCGEICLLSIKDVETHPLIIDLLRHANQDYVGCEPKEQQKEVLQVTRLKSDFNLARVKVESYDSLRPANQGDVGSEEQEEDLRAKRHKAEFNPARVKAEGDANIELMGEKMSTVCGGGYGMVAQPQLHRQTQLNYKEIQLKQQLQLFWERQIEEMKRVNGTSFLD